MATVKAIGGKFVNGRMFTFQESKGEGLFGKSLNVFVDNVNIGTVEHNKSRGWLHPYSGHYYPTKFEAARGLLSFVRKEGLVSIPETEDEMRVKKRRRVEDRIRKDQRALEMCAKILGIE